MGKIYVVLTASFFGQPGSRQHYQVLSSVPGTEFLLEEADSSIRPLSQRRLKMLLADSGKPDVEPEWTGAEPNAQDDDRGCSRDSDCDYQYDPVTMSGIRKHGGVCSEGKPGRCYSTDTVLRQFVETGDSRDPVTREELSDGFLRRLAARADRYYQVYYKTGCPFCQTALAFLEKENIKFKSYNLAVAENRVKLKASHRKVGIDPKAKYTVPQVFFGDEYVGGCTELLERENKKTAT